MVQKLPTIVVLLLAVLGRLGDIDFIMTRIDDPAWLRILIDQPVWLTIGFVALGFWWLWKHQPAANGQSQKRFNIPMWVLVKYIRFESIIAVGHVGSSPYPDERYALLLIRQAAKDGAVTIQGRRELFGETPAWSMVWQDAREGFSDYWARMRLSPRCLDPPAVATAETEPENRNMFPRYPDHAQLRACWEEVQRAWPPAPQFEIEVKASLA